MLLSRTSPTDVLHVLAHLSRNATSKPKQQGMLVLSRCRRFSWPFFVVSNAAFLDLFPPHSQKLMPRNTHCYITFAGSFHIYWPHSRDCLFSVHFSSHFAWNPNFKSPIRTFLPSVWYSSMDEVRPSLNSRQHNFSHLNRELLLYEGRHNPTFLELLSVKVEL